MRFLKDISNIKLNNTIVTLGKFDGNHKGHKLLFDTAVRLKKDDEKAVVFTFDINPRSVINDNAMRTITSHEEKMSCCAEGADKADDPGSAAGCHYPDGIDFVVEFPFNKETMSTEPEDFVKNILVDRLGVSSVVVGKDFRFGRNRSGNVELLSELGKKYNFKVYALDKLKYQPSDYDTPVEISSSVIKEEILRGSMEDVTEMLGEPFCITGHVLHGKHLGNTIGFPTVNLAVPEDKILPPDGVYATKTIVDGKEYTSITNVGKRPTFKDGNQRNVETNLFDFDRDIYGRFIRVDFYRFIRPEVKFSGIDDLKNEIARNKVQVLEYFNSRQNT